MTLFNANTRKDNDSYTSPCLGRNHQLSLLNGKAFVSEFFSLLIGNTSIFLVVE